MKTCKRSLWLAAAFAATFVVAGCARGQGDVDVSATNVASFPAPPQEVSALAAGLTVTTDTSVTVDLEGDLASLEDLGTLSGSVTKNTLSGADLSSVQHIFATIQTADGKLPAVPLTNVDVPDGSTEVDLPLLVSVAQLLDYLSEGKVTLHFYVTGQIPDHKLTLTHTIAAHIDIALSGSVVKL